MREKAQSERGICIKFITPTLKRTGWSIQTQVHEEVFFTAWHILVHKRRHTCTRPCRVDYMLCFQKSRSIAMIEAKEANNRLGYGLKAGLVRTGKTRAQLADAVL